MRLQNSTNASSGSCGGCSASRRLPLLLWLLREQAYSQLSQSPQLMQQQQQQDPSKQQQRRRRHQQQHQQKVGLQRTCFLLTRP
jgi:hypothetical protein